MRAKATAEVIGDMPPFYKLAYLLWGREVDFDSDGDSAYPAAVNWRELTLSKRPGHTERIDIYPFSQDSDMVVLEATSQEMLDKVLVYLSDQGAIAVID
ncbi:MAG: hypothetical protein AAGH99_14205 [Planctomycetota bacterium]